MINQVSKIFSIGILLAIAVVMSTGLAQPKSEQSLPTPWAIVSTSQGVFIIELFERHVPRTVEHFIDLASGNKEWTDPKTKSKQKRPFYNGLLVHRIIPTYLLQTGCPLNNGRGDPGFVIPDEFHPTLKHQEAGIVSMANAGPNTNGSQFFITLRATPWLDVKTVSGKFCSNFELPTRCQTDQHCQRYAEMFAEASSGTPKCENRSFQQGHTIFGKVAYGLPIINRIAEQPLDGNDQPLSPIRIDTITIQRAPQWQRSWLNIK